MNILPKKRWHVRTKDNIARVRKDEALAAEEEKKKQLRIQIAEREARIEALREKARQQYGKEISESPRAMEPHPLPNKHVNFFYELEQNGIINNKPNENYEKEKKLEKEKYEKQIGYLTYLGQDTNEITGQVSWYNKPREENLKDSEEISKRQKIFEDPLQEIRRYIGCDESKKINDSVKSNKSDSGPSLRHKKHKKIKKSKHKKKKRKKKYSSESEMEVGEVIKWGNVDLERLRSERMKREKEERKRADEVLAKVNGISVIKKEDIEPETSQRYNSQFNPHLAKQNYVNR